MLPETFEKHTINREEKLAELRAGLLERSRSFVASLLVLDGTAELSDPLTPRPRPAEGGIRLARGTRLTVKTGRALVRFEDGSDLWLEGGAELDLSPWNEKARALRLLAGRAVAFVAKEVKRPFRALTVHGDVMVTGTAFGLEVGRELLSVSIFHGSVHVDTKNGSIDGQRGQRLVAHRSRAPWAQPLEQAIKDQFAWLGDAAATAANAAVVRPYQAVRKELKLSRVAVAANPATRSARFPAALILALAIVGGGAGTWALWPQDQPDPSGGGSSLLAPVNNSQNSMSSQPAMPPAAAQQPLPTWTTPGTAAPGASPSGSGSTFTIAPGDASASASGSVSGSVADANSNQFFGHNKVRVKIIADDGAIHEIEVDDAEDFMRVAPKMPDADLMKIKEIAEQARAKGEEDAFQIYTWNDGENVLALPPLDGFQNGYKFFTGDLKSLSPELRKKIELDIQSKVFDELGQIEHESEKMQIRIRSIEEATKQLQEMDFNIEISEEAIARIRAAEKERREAERRLEAEKQNQKK